MTRCLFIESKLPPNLWVYVLMAPVLIRNHCYNKNTRKTPYESFIGSKPNLNKMHIFGTTCFCYIQNKTKLDPCCEKGIFVSYDKQNPAYLIYFPKTMAIKRVRCVKFTDFYDNSSLSKLNKNTEFPEYLIIYDVHLKDNLNTKGEGQISRYLIRQRKRPDFFVVKSFEFGGVDYCCTLCTIPTNYTEAINSVNSNNWILVMKREFVSFVENNTFEWQKAQRNKNIVGSRWFFTLKSKNDRSYEYKTHFVAKDYLQIYGKVYRETFALTTSTTSIRLLLQSSMTC